MNGQNNFQIRSAVITGVIQGITLLILLFMVAWREPNPPIKEYGIELFGFSEEENSLETPNDNELINENNQINNESDDDDDDDVVKEVEIVEKVQEQPKVVSNQPETTQAEEVSSDIAQMEAPIVAQPDNNAEANNPSILEKEKTDVNDVKDNSSTVEAKENPTEKPISRDQVSAGKNQSTSIDTRALYKGVSSTNDGPDLQISGWEWGNQKPKPIDMSDEIVGKIVCNIRVDTDGYIVAQLDTYTTPPSVAIAYKNSLDGIQLEMIDDGVVAASTGKVVFILKPKKD